MDNKLLVKSVYADLKNKFSENIDSIYIGTHEEDAFIIIEFNGKFDTSNKEYQAILDSYNYYEIKNLNNKIITLEQRTSIITKNNLTDKQKLRYSIKETLQTKFKLNTLYTYNYNKSLRSNKIFECKKVIYSIRDNPAKIVIMKQINKHDMSDDNLVYTLNKEDCKKLHIKYEPGLEVYSMDLNWKEIKQ